MRLGLDFSSKDNSQPVREMIGGASILLLMVLMVNQLALARLKVGAERDVRSHLYCFGHRLLRCWLVVRAIL
jgi:hypothetical protein